LKGEDFSLRCSAFALSIFAVQIGAMRVPLFALLATTASLGAQNVTVRGIAYDSLRGAPLGAAMISIAGTQRTAISDSRGRFAFDGIAPGQYTFVMQHDVLDSIGFTGRSTRTVIDATHETVTVFVPTFAVLWRAMCGSSAPPRDSAVVYGYVRRASDESVVRGVKVAVAWNDVSYQRKEGFDQKQFGATVPADTTGRYVMCGVPSTTGIQLAAASDSMISGRVEIGPLALRVMRQDLTVAPRAALVSDAPAPARGVVRGELRGVAGAPMAGAIVVTEGVPEVRSNDSGRFVLPNVPAGTRQIAVRAIGAEPQVNTVDVRPGDTTTVAWTMKRAVTLEEVKVTGRRVVDIMKRDITERRQLGVGYFRDSTELGRLNEMVHVFDTFQGIKVLRCAKGLCFSVVTTMNKCVTLWVDRSQWDYAELAVLRPSDIALVEVYPRNVPAEFQTREQCGAAVIWTKRFLK
jgi:hypothetical protein